MILACLIIGTVSCFQIAMGNGVEKTHPDFTADSEKTFCSPSKHRKEMGHAEVDPGNHNDCLGTWL